MSSELSPGGPSGELSHSLEQPATSPEDTDQAPLITDDAENVEGDDDSERDIVIISYDSDSDDDTANPDTPRRQGSISSARFNILSTMVGGGCLSLPLAFQQSGNGLVGPLLLILVGCLSDFCFRLLVASGEVLSPPHIRRPGSHSFESITAAAFGPKAYVMSMGLVTLMCFFGAVGYAVLLRDMMEPINDSLSIANSVKSAWLHQNFTMFSVILAVTPLCTLQTLTALKSAGALSMTSILILGTCIVIRSFQCNWNAPHPWYTYVTFLPESPRMVLDAVPLYISCFVCHYNILPVHNELQRPTKARVSWWLRSTTWFAGILYLVMGFAGSSYGHCTESGHVQGNVLLDFDENDPLLLVGRMCLAVTITLAFPMLVIPARDILLRSVILPYLTKKRQEALARPEEAEAHADDPPPVNQTISEELEEPLLEEGRNNDGEEASTEDSDDSSVKASFLLRLGVSMVIFWVAGGVAACVESIDIVWDLLGSSLSILLSYLIPCGSYLVLTKNQAMATQHKWSRLLCWILIGVFVPLMFISTGNAILNTFF